MSSQTSYKTLQKIWENVSRPGPDGTKRIFFKTRDDLVYLYSTGFVDENRHSLLNWVAAFDDSKQKDGSYLITEEQWMEKALYHYSGPIGVPFEPMTLREGGWSEEEIERLFREQLLPAVYFNEKELRGIWNEAKPTFYSKGKYLITRGVKEDMKNLVEAYPSPAQIRALGVKEARQARGTAGPQTQTGYTTAPSPSLQAAQRLADILKNKR